MKVPELRRNSSIQLFALMVFQTILTDKIADNLAWLRQLEITGDNFYGCVLEFSGRSSEMEKQASVVLILHFNTLL